MSMNSQAQSSASGSADCRFNLSGPTPGILDPEQRNRILRSSASILSFASYDPLAATSLDVAGNIHNLSLKDDTRRFLPPKEIVMETIPGRGSFWRFVPKAQLEENLTDEGEFPRVVEICGERCRISREQWIIYKLDPLYDCVVKLPPALTTIQRKPPTEPPKPSVQTQFSFSSFNDNASATEDGYDSEQMSIDEDAITRTRRPKGPFSKTSAKRARFGFSDLNGERSSGEGNKRKAQTIYQSLSNADENAASIEARQGKTYSSNFQKRVRTLSPESQQRHMGGLRRQLDKKKRKRFEERMQEHKFQQEQKLMEEVLSEVPYFQPSGNGGYDFDDTTTDGMDPQDEFDGQPHTQETEEEAEHRRIIEESRRKLAELEADRPLWEEAKRQREQKEQQEESSRQQVKLEKQRREEERKRQEEEAARQYQLEEEARQQRSRQEKLERLERERRNLYHQWNSGRWDPCRAVQRYKTVSQFFDAQKFSTEDFPLTFHDVPWPTLRHPEENCPEYMDWAAVKEFFDVAKQLIRGQEYRDFLKASVSRFHPDRWRSRNLLKGILSINERDCVEVAVIAVSQALGSVWDDLKGT